MDILDKEVKEAKRQNKIKTKEKHEKYLKYKKQEELKKKQRHKACKEYITKYLLPKIADHISRNNAYFTLKSDSIRTHGPDRMKFYEDDLNKAFTALGIDIVIDTEIYSIDHPEYNKLCFHIDKLLKRYNSKKKER
jgi:molecular chaperone GrpE (heat shock protein)